jgi:hypothetical protein
MAAPEEFSMRLDLTVDGQDQLGLPRLYPGDRVVWRFQVLDEDGVPFDLTGFHITWTGRRKKGDAEPIFRRRSVDNITGTSTKEIAIDDQTTEDLVAYTGTGWFECRFFSSAAEETELLGALGMIFFDIVLQALDGTTTTFAEGVLEIPRRMTRVADV